MEVPTIYLKIQEQLSDRNLKIVAERTGISHYRVWRIATGKSKRPALEDIETIMKYLEK